MWVINLAGYRLDLSGKSGVSCFLVLDGSLSSSWCSYSMMFSRRVNQYDLGGNTKKQLQRRGGGHAHVIRLGLPQNILNYRSIYNMYINVVISIIILSLAVEVEVVLLSLLLSLICNKNIFVIIIFIIIFIIIIITTLF